MKLTFLKIVSNVTICLICALAPVPEYFTIKKPVDIHKIQYSGSNSCLSSLSYMTKIRNLDPKPLSLEFP